MMGKYGVTFALGSYKKCKYGNSLFVIRILSKMYEDNESSTKVDLSKARKILKDLTIFGKFDTPEDYIVQVLRKVTENSELELEANLSGVKALQMLTYKYKRYTLTYEEYEAMIRLYREIIDRAIFNIRNKAPSLDFYITIPVSKVDRIYETYSKNVSSETCVERYKQTLAAFLFYHNFLGIDVNMYSETEDEYILQIADTMK
ncbi:MAG: hypothetical protein IJ809_05260 [Clostridia bacterium]|nr:hypothetical protein [Clostridia bacterium]